MNQKTKKVLKIVGDCLFGVFMVLIALFAISNIRAKNNNGIPNAFGKGYLTVLSPSMDGDREDSFKVGDLITVKVLKNGSKDLKVDQIITYYNPNEKNPKTNEKGMIISHRIVEIIPVEGTEYIFYKVKGDADADMPSSYYNVRNDDVLAVYTGKVSGAGKAVGWFQSFGGFFVVVVLPCLLFLVVELIQFIKTYAEVKGESVAKKSEEELAAEREEMKRQLLAELKAEMAAKEAVEEEKVEEKTEE